MHKIINIFTWDSTIEHVIYDPIVFIIYLVLIYLLVFLLFKQFKIIKFIRKFIFFGFLSIFTEKIKLIWFIQKIKKERNIDLSINLFTTNVIDEAHSSGGYKQMDISISIDFLTNNLEIEFLKIKQLYSLNKDIDYMVYYNKIPTSAELEKDKLTNRIELTNYIGTSIRQIKIIDCLEEYYLDFNKDWLGEKISCLLNNRLNWSNDNLEKLKEYGINF